MQLELILIIKMNIQSSSEIELFLAQESNARVMIRDIEGCIDYNPLFF